MGIKRKNIQTCHIIFNKQAVYEKGTEWEKGLLHKCR